MNIWNDTSNPWKIASSLLAVLLVIFLVSSCSDTLTGDSNNSDMNGESNNVTRMNVHLTDAPADYQEVNIDVQELRIHFTPADSADEDSLKDGKWIDLPVDPMVVNLLELQNGVDTLLASAELDPGHYRELRLVLGSDNTVMVDSTLHTLKVPSGQQSGYKIKFATDLEEGEELDVVIDFDASRSVHKAGRSGKFILKPVLRAFVENGDEVDTGSLSGVVEPVEASPTLIAVMEEDTAATTQADTSGAFLIEGLKEGMYDLHINPVDTSGYADTTLTDIEIDAGEETDLGTITLSSN